MATGSVLKGDDYHNKFDSDWYLKTYYSNSTLPEAGALTFLYDELHKAFGRGEVKGRRYLEFGSGPTVHGLFSARNAFDYMACCEFAECNRKQIEKWWRNEEGAYDWSELLKYVAKLEQHNDHERIAAEVRAKLQEVLPCDVHQKNPLHPNIREPYDVIMTSLTLEAACESLQQYNDAVSNVSRLLCKGGHLIMFGAVNESFYFVNGEKFFCLRLRQEDIENALKMAGFQNIKTQIKELPSAAALADLDGFFYTTCTKA